MINVNQYLNKSSEELEADYITLNEHFSSNLEEAKKKRAGMPPELIKTLRRKAKTDLFFLAYSILGYDRLVPTLHGHLCKWMELNKGEKYKEILLPRAHFKSTVVTIADIIQTVLPDDEGDQPHPYNLGTNARVLICHEVASMASGYLYSITAHFMSNPLLMALFPECVPKNRAQKINTRALELPRSKIWNEPTIGTMGVGGKSQGLHYDKLVFDDLIGPDAVESETIMNATKTWFDSIQGFFVKLSESVFTVVGTRYALDDIYDHIEQRYAGQLKIYRRSMEEPDYSDMIINEKGKRVPRMKIIFEEEISPNDLVILKKNKSVYAAQYMNDPTGGDLTFQPEWIRNFIWSSSNSIYVPESLPHMPRTLSVSSLYKLFLLDPALGGGLTGWCVVGSDAFGRHFVLESGQEMIEPTAMMQKFFTYYAKYKFNSLVIEKVLFSALYEPWINAEFRLRGTRFNVEMLGIDNSKDKAFRVRGLMHDFEAGNMHFNDKYYTKTQDRTNNDSDLIYQIKKFGAIKDYHILDTLAQLPKVARRAVDTQWEQNRVNLERQQLARSYTGYSQIKYKR